MANSLSKYFTGISAKRLRLVEINPKKSNQHELNGTTEFKYFLGSERRKYNGKFIYINDNEENTLEKDISFTWYDSREKVDHRNSEFRLYYESNDCITSAEVGDLLIIGKTISDELIVIIAQKDSTAEKQLLWLFGIHEVGNKFIVKDLSHETAALGYAAKYIISLLGIDVEEAETNYVEELFKLFKGKLPTTKVFSAYARSTVKNVSPIEAPDETLLTWMGREMLLFKSIESQEIKKKLNEGFGKNGDDVDEFIAFSLSMQNRRKARAGFAFENHLASIFELNQVAFSNGAITERNNKPDFIFPSIKSYHDDSFDVQLLTMLGLKTTAKDRWRQILPEADKILQKHLITLEPSISKRQTDEMTVRNVQLIIPKPITETYTDAQRLNLINLSDFIKYVGTKQTIVTKRVY